MKKLILVALFLLSGLAFAQGVRYDVPPILGPTGQPLPNIAVTLCSGTGSISGATCSPQIQSFTDITLGVPCALATPVTLTTSTQCQATSDSFGNAGFWLSPGAYIYCLTGRGIAGACYNLTVPAGSTPSGILRSGTIQLGDGSAAAPSYSFTSQSGTGFFHPGGGSTGVSVSGVQRFNFGANLQQDGTAGSYCFTNGNPFSNACDTGISRVSSGVLAVGNGITGDTSGTVSLTGLQGSGWKTITDVNRTGQARFQPTANNSTAFLTLMPSGTSTESDFRLYNASDPLNTGTVDFDLLGTTVSLSPFSFGTGSQPTALQLNNLFQKFNADTSISRTGAGTLVIGNGTAGDASGTLNLQNLNSPALGTATSIPTNFGSGSITFGSSVWNGSSAVSVPASLTYGPAQVTNPNMFLTLNFPSTLLAGSFFQLQNLKAATSGSNVSSPTLQFIGQSWNGSASQQDLWAIQNVLGTGTNPINTLSFTRFGGSSAGTISMPMLSFPTQAAPQNPSTGSITIYGDSGSGNLTCRNSTGGSCFSATAAAPFISGSPNPAGSGILRVASNDVAVAFRNNANSGDIQALTKDTNDVVQVGQAAGMKSNTFQATSNSGLPASCAGGAFFVNDAATPNSADICFGDGTGWLFNLTKRTGSASTSVFSVKDTGVANATTGYQVGGSAANGNVLRGNGTNFVSAQPGAGDLSNGVTGSGAVVLQNNLVVSHPQVNTGIVNSGSGMMHVRATSCTTPAAVNGSCSGTVTWPGTWADTNYTAVCTPDNTGQSSTVSVTALFSKTTTNMQVGIANPPGSGTAVTTVLNCIGVHD